jgi:predicted RNase H-like nuclease
MISKTDCVAGVDGCRGGWLVALSDLQSGSCELRLCATFAEILDLAEAPAIIAVDMPIGLPDQAGRGGRACDVGARSRLGERQSSVFSVPARAAIMENDYARACATALARSDPPRKVSKQCFHLFHKIREIDDLMTPALQARVYECHPELAFWAMNGHRPMSLPKKVRNRPDAPGLTERRILLECHGFRPDLFEMPPWPRSLVGADDIVDACVLSWSAARIVRGDAIRLPPEPPVDGRGLRMEINA